MIEKDTIKHHNLKQKHMYATMLPTSYAITVICIYTGWPKKLVPFFVRLNFIKY